MILHKVVIDLMDCCMDTDQTCNDLEDYRAAVNLDFSKRLCE